MRIKTHRHGQAAMEQSRQAGDTGLRLQRDLSCSSREERKKKKRKKIHLRGNTHQQGRGQGQGGANACREETDSFVYRQR